MSLDLDALSASIPAADRADDHAVDIEPADHVVDIEPALRSATRRVAPVWPLDRFVAVNPYLGLADHAFVDAAHRLALAAGARTTLPADHYLQALADGRIAAEDIGDALARSGSSLGLDADGLIAEATAMRQSGASGPLLPTMPDRNPSSTTVGMMNRDQRNRLARSCAGLASRFIRTPVSVSGQ